MTAPVLDNHLHLDPDRGRGLAAVREFAQAGGTHLLLVNQPSWKLTGTPETSTDFTAGFEQTVQLAADATDLLPGRAWPVLGVHPALISRLVDEAGMTVTEAGTLMKHGLEVAAEYAACGPTVALKSGRPHYDVPSEIWEESNGVLRHALGLGAETGVAVQLHTEATRELTEIKEWADDAGLPAEQVVKHYAEGPCIGVVPSVISNRSALSEMSETGEPFLMETDYLDDPDRPGAVLGPKTVPRRTKWLREQGYHDAVHRAHVETPQRVYGIDTRIG